MADAVIVSLSCCFLLSACLYFERLAFTVVVRDFHLEEVRSSPAAATFENGVLREGTVID